MKHILILILILPALTGTAFSADTCACCSNKKIISPAAPKPTAPLAAVSCSALSLQWKGSPGQTFVITAIIKNAATNRVIKTITTSNYAVNGSTNSISIASGPGTSVYWSIEAISIINGRNFYSYPLRADKDYIIPSCTPPEASPNKITVETIKQPGLEKMKVKVYPNPVRSLLTIEFEEAGSSQKAISIFDINGKMVSTQRTSGNKTQVNVKSLTPGNYFIRIQQGDNKPVYNGKVIKD